MAPIDDLLKLYKEKWSRNRSPIEISHFIGWSWLCYYEKQVMYLIVRTRKRG